MPASFANESPVDCVQDIRGDSFFFVLRIKFRRDIIDENGQSVNERERDGEGRWGERERKNILLKMEKFLERHTHTRPYIYLEL